MGPPVTKLSIVVLGENRRFAVIYVPPEPPLAACTQSIPETQLQTLADSGVEAGKIFQDLGFSGSVLVGDRHC